MSDSGREPVTDQRLLLDRLSADAWPPLEQTEVDGWRLRASRGVTRRGNSALPLTGALPLGAVQEFYAARGLPAAVQVSDPALDAQLAERGWTLEMPTAVMTGPLPPQTDGQGADGQVAPAPDEEWLACWWAVDGRGGPAELDVSRRCLSLVTAPAGYAAVRSQGQLVGVARGVVQEGWLGIFAVAVSSEHRRRGIAGRLLGQLGCWAGTLGATASYLQVRQDNEAALALYGRRRFVQAYPYWYRYGPRP